MQAGRPYNSLGIIDIDAVGARYYRTLINIVP